MYSHLKIILIPSLLFCGGVKYEYRLKGRFVKWYHIATICLLILIIVINQLTLVQGFIVMPFLCYYLQVHDCMIAILGIAVLVSLHHWILSLFLRWLKWDRGIPGLGICNTRCEAENNQILLKTCSSRLAHVFGLRSFISQVKNADNCSSTKSKLWKILQFQWIPQLSPTIHNDQVCTLATFRQGRQNVISSFLDAHGAGPSVIRFFCTFQIFSIFGAVSTLLGMAMSYLNTMVGN